MRIRDWLFTLAVVVCIIAASYAAGRFVVPV